MVCRFAQNEKIRNGISELGGNKTKESTTRTKLQSADLKNIVHLWVEGNLLVAGPFIDQESPRGIFILKIETQEETQNEQNQILPFWPKT